MGTRSLTFVYDEAGDPLLNMYRQFDGYMSGHGAELAEFLHDRKLVNGLSFEDQNNPKVSNGMGCLAAQLLAHFKQTPGSFYIHAVDDTHCGQDYEYHVFPDRVFVCESDGAVVLDTTWESFYNVTHKEAVVL